MNVHTRSSERREILAAARRYRRNGYMVSGPDELSARPGFLGDFVPDLIAERADDKVVVGVKRAASVRGSNDIVELAERVAAQPGWRFELIAVPETDRIEMPDLNWIGEDIERLIDKDLTKAAFILIHASIENIVASASARRNKNPANSTFPYLVRDLVVQGIIDEDVRRDIDQASTMQSILMHAKTELTPTREDVERLMTLAVGLQKAVLEGANA